MISTGKRRRGALLPSEEHKKMYTRNQLLNIRKINCMATLSEKFETATLVILRCENDATEHDKNKSRAGSIPKPEQ